jgi:hypothetical protein
MADKVRVTQTQSSCSVFGFSFLSTLVVRDDGTYMLLCDYVMVLEEL